MPGKAVMASARAACPANLCKLFCWSRSSGKLHRSQTPPDATGLWASHNKSGMSDSRQSKWPHREGQEQGGLQWDGQICQPPTCPAHIIQEKPSCHPRGSPPGPAPWWQPRPAAISQTDAFTLLRASHVLSGWQFPNVERQVQLKPL